jgi:heavy metal sensor kinase
MKRSRSRFSRLPLRWRLTLWYLLSFTILLLLVVGFLYWQVQRTLLAQMDAGLQLTAQQALVNVAAENGRLAFQNLENNPQLSRTLSDNIGIFLVAPTGEIWQQVGLAGEKPPISLMVGWRTVSDGDDVWRLYAEQISMESGGWLLVAQSLEPVTESLAVLAWQMMWITPLALLLAGAGGYFLAGRALHPIDDMIRTAQSIHAQDLTQRIFYNGPADEVGRLAATINGMLARLQAGFARERRFTGDVAHELRTPLTALKGRIGVTLSQPRPAEQYVTTLQEMEGQVDRLIRLSNDLLFLTRLDQEQMKLHQETIIVSDLLGAVIEQIRPLAAARSLTFQELYVTGLTVYGDMDLLIRLFLNLLHNAVKYTPVRGRISITAGQSQDVVAISITDTGPGISPAHLPYLFERFYRVEADRARHDGAGAGLGLAIAYEIVQAHHGRITVQSEPGQGTTFVVELPSLS